MNPPQNLDLNIIKAVWNNVFTENRTKGSQHPNKSFGKAFKAPGELFLKIIVETSFKLSKTEADGY